MYRNMLKSKIHRATITDADLNYVGSITIDEDLMDAANILPNEKVQVVNNNNGARFETYAIPGARGSGIVCLNGAAARLAYKGDIVIILGYGLIDDKEARDFKADLVFVDKNNQIIEKKKG